MSCEMSSVPSATMSADIDPSVAVLPSNVPPAMVQSAVLEPVSLSRFADNILERTEPGIPADRAEVEARRAAPAELQDVVAAGALHRAADTVAPSTASVTPPPNTMAVAPLMTFELNTPTPDVPLRSMAVPAPLEMIPVLVISATNVVNDRTNAVLLPAEIVPELVIPPESVPPETERPIPEDISPAMVPEWVMRPVNVTPR